jgi:Phage integrase family
MAFDAVGELAGSGSASVRGCEKTLISFTAGTGSDATPMSVGAASVVSVEPSVSVEDTEVEGSCAGASEERASTLPQPTATASVIAARGNVSHPPMRIGSRRSRVPDGSRSSPPSRPGCIAGSSWRFDGGDVDWFGRRVWVRRNVNRHGQFQEPKTRGSVRAIAMLQTLATALREHQLASPFSDEDDLVFASEKGTPLDGHNFVRRVFEPALRRAGLPKIRFHDLRHTFASLLIAQGEHPKLISEQLGHASVQITLDRYGHLLPASYDSAGERLNAALFGTGLQAFAGSGADNAFRAVPPVDTRCPFRQ